MWKLLPGAALIFLTGLLDDVVGIPAILGAVFLGGLRRNFQHRASILWLLFFGWMILSVPFSTWKAGSWARIADYGRFELPLLFVVGGLAANWKEVRAIFAAIACAAGFNLLTVHLLGDMSNGRINLADKSGSLGNANDLATQLLLLLPFLLFILLDRKNVVLRTVLGGAILYGSYLILGTGSRGGMLGLAFAYVVCVFLSSTARRTAALAVGAAAAVTIPLFLPALTLNRLGTVFGETNEDATESSAARSYLFQRSVDYTLEHPLFGVGPDQFPNFEGTESRSKGSHGIWHTTHCTYTQVSSECGIPALLFFAGAIASAMMLVLRLYKSARRGGCKDISLPLLFGRDVRLPSIDRILISRLHLSDSCDDWFGYFDDVRRQ